MFSHWRRLVKKLGKMVVIIDESIGVSQLFLTCPGCSSPEVYTYVCMYVCSELINSWKETAY